MGFFCLSWFSGFGGLFVCLGLFWVFFKITSVPSTIVFPSNRVSYALLVTARYGTVGALIVHEIRIYHSYKQTATGFEVNLFQKGAVCVQK